ncbi:MAG TPA: solute carrier family 23 protein [Stellaceae bacterium]|nr:solute carrier family 23 protein [Stellaceae bacterium]
MSSTVSKSDSFFPRWALKPEGMVLPEERLPAGPTIVAGIQHIIAMFGSTVLGPILMGLNPNLAIFFSGIATLIFFAITGGRVPSYLGTSFSFIAVVIAATGYAGSGPNPEVGIALGGILAAGALYAAIGILVQLAGYRWIERLMPPVLTGSIVAIIGLNLAPIAIKHISANPLGTWVGIATVVAVAAVACHASGIARRLPILAGGGAAYLLYLALANGLGLSQPIDFAPLADAAWFAWPSFAAPEFDGRAISLIAPVAIILVAENLGHVKAIGGMTGRPLDAWLGRAFLGDGIATMLSAAFGGPGVTTYAENMGVMAVTRIYSTLVFMVAGLIAVLIGLSPKIGALVLTIPEPVIGGLSIVVFGLIAATAGRIWVENRVDFSDPRNLLTVGVALTLGAGDLTLPLGNFTLSGIATATFGAIILYHLLRPGRDGAPGETFQ